LVEIGVQRCNHVLRDRAFVEGARPVLGDGLERCGERRKLDHAALGRRLAIEQVMARGALAVAELGKLLCPVETDTRRDREAVLCVVDRRREHAIERPRPACLEDRAPGFDRAGHIDRERRGRRNRRHALVEQRLRGGLRAGAAAAVVAPHRLAGLGDQREAVAADAGHVWFNHAEHRNCGDCGIDRVAAGTQDVDGRQRRERMRGRSHAVLGDDRRAAREMEVACHETNPAMEME
jgi:hypothetical protein